MLKCNHEDEEIILNFQALEVQNGRVHVRWNNLTVFNGTSTTASPTLKRTANTFETTLHGKSGANVLQVVFERLNPGKAAGAGVALRIKGVQKGFAECEDQVAPHN